jgi:hypothetical protein
MIRIIGRPEFYVPLTIDQVNVLTALAMHHYDELCRATVGPKGFLTAAAQQLRLEAEMDMGDDSVIAMSYFQLDACIRILEWTGRLAMTEKVLADEMFKLFTGAMKTATEAAVNWKTTF